MCDLTFQWVGVGENLQETLLLHGLAIQISGFAVEFPNQSIDIHGLVVGHVESHEVLMISLEKSSPNPVLGWAMG